VAEETSQTTYSQLRSSSSHPINAHIPDDDGDGDNGDKKAKGGKRACPLRHFPPCHFRVRWERARVGIRPAAVLASPAAIYHGSHAQAQAGRRRPAGRPAAFF